VSLTLVSLVLLAAASIDKYPRQPIDVVDYRFALELTDSSDIVAGEATIDLWVTRDSLASFWLDLIEPTDGRGMRVSAVTVDGAPVAFRHAAGRLEIPLPPGMARRRLAVTVSYRGIPATGLLIGNNRHGQRTFFSDNWPDKTRHWLPVIDHVSDKATSTFAVTAPAHYQVISNGALAETTDLPGDRRRTIWRQSVPIAPWLFALGVARFAVQEIGTHHGAPVSTWVFAPDRDAGFHDFAVPSLEALAFYHERIGAFAYQKLANVQSNSVAGGMEAASSIFYSAGSVTGRRDKRWRNVIVHEIAHQWWGNSVTERDWDDVWLSEGFATYFTLLFIEHGYGRDEFVDGLRKSRQTVIDFDRANPGYRVIHDQLADMSKVTTRQTYEKGGWTLHMLREQIGSDRFWAGIREYYRIHRDGHASTDDFRKVMERSAGQPLRWFFDQWLTRGGSPVIGGTWRHDRRAETVELEVLQTQSGPPFRFPLELAIRFADGSSQVETVTLREARQRFTIAVKAAPTAIQLDPNVRLLFSGELTAR